MSRRAIHLGDPLNTKLHPAGRAVRAYPASAIVVLHDPHADTRLPFGHSGTHRNDDAAWLMPGDHRPGAHLKAECRGAAGRPVELEIAAAHSGRLDFEHDLTRPGRRIRKFDELHPPVAGENHSLHLPLPSCTEGTGGRMDFVRAGPDHRPKLTRRTSAA